MAPATSESSTSESTPNSRHSGIFSQFKRSINLVLSIIHCEGRLTVKFSMMVLAFSICPFFKN